MTHPNERAYPSSNGQCLGLTKRELFAAMAMQGICGDVDIRVEESVEVIAKTAVRVADALIKALNETKE